MIESITDSLANTIRELPFISLSGGIARVQKIKDGPTLKSLPAMPDPDNANNYIWLTPNSKETGISYFELLSNDFVDDINGGLGQIYRANLRLFVWLNLARISPPNMGAIIATTVAAVLKSNVDNEFVKVHRISPVREVIKNADMFFRYTYNEAETQFLMLPYDYFAFDFNIIYVPSPTCDTVNFIQKDIFQC